MADEQSEHGDDPQWDLKYRSEEEMDFFTEMALHETERWIEAVTRQRFQYPDDPRKSLENGVQLCELLNCLKPGSVKKINQFSTPLAGIDNINVFLEACRSTFGLTNTQLFDSSELEDLSQRAIADESTHLKEENDRRLRNVAVTIYFLGKVATASNFDGPQIDFNAFSGLFEHQHVDLIPDKTSVYSRSWDNKRIQSNHACSKVLVRQEAVADGRPSEGYEEDQHTGDSSYESIGSKGSDDNQSLGSADGMPVTSDMYHYGGSMSSLHQTGSLDNDMYQSTPNLYQGSNKSSHSVDSANGMSVGSHSRQSSGSMDNYPTRLLTQRSTSIIVDPLQFIKLKVNPLVEHAEKQRKLCEKNKEVKTSVLIENDEDWQNNLKSWKSRRRQNYSRRDELEDSLDQATKRSVKTYKEIVKQREKRRSMSIPFYGEDDVENGNLFTSSTSNSVNNDGSDKETDSTRTSCGPGSGNSVISKKDDDEVFEIKSRSFNDGDQVQHPANYKQKELEVNNNNNTSSSSKPDITLANNRQDNKKVDASPKKPEYSNKNNELHSEMASTKISSPKPERVSSPRPEKVDSSESEEEWIKVEGEDFVERTIRISQKLKKGFGFLIKDGIDRNSPVVVHRIQLGSAADICELRPKDVITSINKIDIRQLTQQKIQQYIDKAVQVGQIELRVRRYLRGAIGNDDDLDFPSDEDVGIKPKSAYNSLRLESQPTTLTTKQMKNDISAEQISSNEIPELVKVQTSHIEEELPVEVKTAAMQYTLTENLPSVTTAIRRPEPNLDITNGMNNCSVVDFPVTSQVAVNSKDMETTPKIVHTKTLSNPVENLLAKDKANLTTAHQRSISSDSTVPSFSSSIQPPALLRRWQQSKSKLDGPSVGLSSSLPMDSEKPPIGTDTTVSLNSSLLLPRRSSLQNEQLYDSAATRRRSESFEKSLFVVRDIRRYALDNENTSRVFLPTLNSQVKYQVSATKDQPTAQPIIKSEVITTNVLSPLIIQIPTHHSSTSLLQIDPNNQMPQPGPDGSESNLPEYTFKVDLKKGAIEEEINNTTASEDVRYSSGLVAGESDEEVMDEEEMERQRLAEEEENAKLMEKRIAEEDRMIAQERHLIEQEKLKRLEEERVRREAEDKERLQQKKELIRQKEKQFEEDKRKFEIEKQEVEEQRRALQEQQLLHQQFLEQQQQLKLVQQQQELQQQQQQQTAMISQTLYLERSSNRQPTARVHQPHTMEVPINTSPKYISPQIGNSIDSSSKSGSVHIGPQKKPVLSNRMESVISRFTKLTDMEEKESTRLTREDLVAMNRKATPLQEKPEMNANSSQRLSPIRREPPSKGELRSLNAVPKARHRDPKEWIVSDNEVERKPVGRSANRRPEFSSSKEHLNTAQNWNAYPNEQVSKHTEVVHRQEGLPRETARGGIQAHWLVEEAERRRLAEHRDANQDFRGASPENGHKYSNYPIKPTNEGPSNLWKDQVHSKGTKQLGVKIPIYNRTMKIAPSSSPRSSISSENSLNPINNRASYASYGGSISPQSLGSPSIAQTSEGYASMTAGDSLSPRSSGSLSNQTSDVYGSSLTGEHLNSKSLQYQTSIPSYSKPLLHHQREDSSSSKHSYKSSTSNNSSEMPEQVAVSGIEKCSHCDQELGFGAAMVVESLGLYYHVRCFRCCVCHFQLGNGCQGTDVRVRAGKLHCYNCYSNDEGLRNTLHYIDLITDCTMMDDTALAQNCDIVDIAFEDLGFQKQL